MADIAASVLARLKNKANESGRSYQLCLQLFCQEEFLRRLEKSEYAENLVLKGGLFIYSLTDFDSRVTVDVDFLLRQIPNTPEQLKAVLEEIIATPTGNDFITFEIKDVAPIAVAKKYAGIGASVVARIKNTRTPFSIDFGVGDVIVPKQEKRKIPTQLDDFASPTVNTYSLETTIAEKLDAILDLMEFSSRMKDYYDIYYLANKFDFDGKILAEALKKTFANRGHSFTVEQFEKVLTFGSDDAMQKKWKAFCKKIDTKTGDYNTVLRTIKAFLTEPFTAAVEDNLFTDTWTAQNGEWMKEDVMSINNNPHNSINTSMLDAMRKLQETSALTVAHNLQASSAAIAALKTETTSVFEAVRELRSTLNATKLSMGDVTAAIEEYRRTVAPLAESIKTMKLAYAPIFEQTKAFDFDTLNIKGVISGLRTSASAMRAISELNFSGFASIIDALPKSDFLPDMVANDFSVDIVEKLYESGEITQDDINEEITEIVNKKQFSPKAEWDKIKKSKWFIAIKILIIIATFVCNPIAEYATDKALDKLGINKFWENSSIYDLIDSIFGESEDRTVSEKEAKETIDKTKTGNVSKQRREDLLAKIKDIRTFISSAPQDENTGNLLSYLSDLEKDVNGKKYGLVFEEHREEIDEVLDTHTPVLTEDKDLFIDNGGQMNFLIEGDNLASLKLLEKTHKGKIDLIYIDPPYNTLSEGFIYSDIQIDKTDMFQHSKWSSLMHNRLKYAKKLLSDKGVIFISIDDNELYSLKFLCDEILGLENYISTIAVIIKPEGRRYGAFAKTHEYILVYANNIDRIQLNEIEVEGVEYKYYDEIGGFNLKGLRNRNVQAFNSTNRPNLRYPFYVDINNPDKDGLCLVSTEPQDGYIEVWASTVDGLESVWRWGKETATIKINDLVAYRGRDNEIRIFQKERKLTRTAKTIWDGKEFISQKGTKEIQAILGKGKFDFPKPLELISRIIKIGTDEETTVLDFFAGSGTTGHAVMKLNAEDGGNRRFILCTNNENNICRDVTYERIKRVIDKEGYAASLKYYKVDYVPISDRMYYEYADELLLHIRELVELENGINFKDNTEIAIVLTEEEFADFMANIEVYGKCRKLYMGHDLLPDEDQEQSLAKHDIEVNIIPDYYYQDLQEV